MYNKSITQTKNQATYMLTKIEKTIVARSYLNLITRYHVRPSSLTYAVNF